MNYNFPNSLKAHYEIHKTVEGSSFGLSEGPTSFPQIQPWHPRHGGGSGSLKPRCDALRQGRCGTDNVSNDLFGAGHEATSHHIDSIHPSASGDRYIAELTVTKRRLTVY